MTSPVTYTSQVLPALLDMAIFYGIMGLCLWIGRLIERRVQQGAK